MKLVITSDCHGRLNTASLPKGDVLILAGDILPNRYGDPEKDADYQVDPLRALDRECSKLDFKHRLIIAGNHDWVFERRPDARGGLKHLTYLEDEAIEIEGVKFYGSPHQPVFFDWAFNLPRNGPELKKHWDNIPSDTDVLITHGPPFGVLDQPYGNGYHAGCELLEQRVSKVKPKVHTFGHIHGSYGRLLRNGTLFVNASLCDEAYEPVNEPWVIDLDDLGHLHVCGRAVKV